MDRFRGSFETSSAFLLRIVSYIFLDSDFDWSAKLSFFGCSVVVVKLAHWSGLASHKEMFNDLFRSEWWVVMGSRSVWKLSMNALLSSTTFGVSLIRFQAVEINGNSFQCFSMTKTSLFSRNQLISLSDPGDDVAAWMAHNTTIQRIIFCSTDATHKYAILNIGLSGITVVYVNVDWAGSFNQRRIEDFINMAPSTALSNKNYDELAPKQVCGFPFAASNIFSY